MIILVIGSGAREHAIVTALARADDVVLHAAPGNPGIAELATLHPLDLSDADPAALAQRCADVAVAVGADLVVVGPEVPLVAGAADAIRAAGIACFGPSAAAARLEGSKAFAKEIMAAADVPTAMAYVCDTVPEAEAALNKLGAPYVVKDDGLAAGKGVVVTEDRDAALAHAASCLERDGGRVVIEEYLDGPELSLFCITDGTTVLPLQPAQDYKRQGDGDTGANTGGMGSYSPVPGVTKDLVDEVVARVAEPVVFELARRGTPFSGLLYCGLALTSRGLRVVEFNARFGDPETQVILPRLVTSLAAVLTAAAKGDLEHIGSLVWSPDAVVDVVLAAPGYPGSVAVGGRIDGIDAAQAIDGVSVLHAGTAEVDGVLVAAGGRVLSVVAQGADVEEARAKAYRAIACIELAGSHYRTDIAAPRA